jgi:hypothetical protein
MNLRESTRRTMIEMARRRQQPGAGSSRDFLRSRTARMQYPNLRAVLADLDWATVGAAAARLYMPERATDDLDIIIHASDAAESRERLAQAGFSYLGPLSIGGGQWQSAEGFPVDVIESAEAWVKQALTEARSNPDPQGMLVLPLPYLILMKYRASRLQDIADVGRMLGQATDDQMAAIRSVFARWEPGGLEDLESLVTLGRLEME